MEIIDLFEDRILVKRDEAEKKTKSGIIIPDAIVEPPARGVVINVGPGRDGGSRMPKAGDTILFSKHSGTEIKFNDIEYLLMRSTDVFGIITTVDSTDVN